MGGFHFDTKKAGAELAAPNWLPPLKSWTHVVCVADSVNKKMAIWANGDKVEEGPFTDGANIGFHSPFNLGRRPGGYDDWFLAGQVDEVRVYSRALSAAEIGELYNSESGLTKTLQVRVESMRLTLRTSVGGRYILQASSDMRSWSDFGPAFIADVPNYEVVVPANEARRFWRFVEAP